MTALQVGFEKHGYPSGERCLTALVASLQEMGFELLEDLGGLQVAEIDALDLTLADAVFLERMAASVLVKRSASWKPNAANVIVPKLRTNIGQHVEATLLDRRLNTELAFFYSDYSQYQTLVQEITATGTSFSILNAGAAELKGVEWIIQWIATQQLSLGFSGNITDAEVTDVSITPAAKREGDPMDNVPENSYSFNVDYRFSWSGSVSGFVRLDYNHQGKDGRADRLQGFAQEVIYSDSINLINLNIGAQWEALQLTLFGRNLSDEDELLTATHTSSGSQSRPRTLGVQFNYDF